jgi:hypothetical protein
MRVAPSAAYRVGLILACAASPALALDVDITRVNGHTLRTQLGDGTGVIVGIVDSGVRSTHPFLAGNDSLGRPRLVAQANFVATEPTNTGDDVFGHGTAVAGAMLSSDASLRAVASDARYISARALDSRNSFLFDDWVINATGFAVGNGANILNLSLGYGAADQTGQSKLALMADYLSGTRKIPVVTSAGNIGNSTTPRPQGPGDGYNVFSVAGSSAFSYNQVAPFSNWNLTGDGRGKPDITAPGQAIQTANVSFASPGQSLTLLASGTSFSAASTSAFLASQIEFGRAHSLSTDPLVLKATLLNSAEKIRGRSGANWSPHSAATSTSGVYFVTGPLDRSAGAGQIDGAALARQYAAGEFSPGNVPATGWDLAALTGSSSVYTLGSLAAGSSLNLSLAWNRAVNWLDNNSNSTIDVADGFVQAGALADLNLALFRDGNLVAESVSEVDNFEHLWLTGLLPGTYSIRITGDVPGTEYAVAWLGTPVPEPGAVVVLASVGMLGLRRRAK